MHIDPGKILPTEFYLRKDVIQIARDLLGKVLCSRINGQETSAIIVETEAYRAPDDKASHAYNNRRTARTEIMFGPGGMAYVYLCYGIHHLFNVVTAPSEMAHAVLIRAVEPLGNVPLMLERRGMAVLAPRLTAGPGSLSKALGIRTSHTGTDLMDPSGPIWILDGGRQIPSKNIIASARVGVDYAEECADWPWRFRIGGSQWTSPAK